MSDTIVLKDKNLKMLLRAFKGGLPQVQIGVLDGGSRRDGVSNALVGAIHEFGSANCPKRSWLREPLTDELESYLNHSGAFEKENLAEVVKSGTLVPWMKRVSIACEQVIQDGFNTGGFGKWTPSDMSRKKNHQTLVETQQLRNSVTSRVK